MDIDGLATLLSSVHLTGILTRVGWLIPALVSLAALAVAFRTYRRKAGVDIRGLYTKMQSIDCDDIYISTVILENMKDRAITIFAIYLKLGNTCYLELDNFENSSLILRPFETFHREYGPVSYYSAGGDSRIVLNNAFGSNKMRRRLVLSTSLGKYTVPSDVPSWDPIFELFKNHMTALAQPIRLTYRDKAYGSNIKYLAEFESGNGDVEVVPIHFTDVERNTFKAFRLTREAIESKITLENFFQRQKGEGKLAGKSFKVHDLEAWRAEHYRLGEMQTIRWTDVGKFRYYVMGRVLTKLEDWRLKLKNRSLAKRNQQHNRR